MNTLRSGQPNITDDNVRILVCCHKACTLPNDSHLVPVMGGAINNESVPDGFYRDDRVNEVPCDNISDKNATYCELTSMYWAWKHMREVFPSVEYIGLNHYRRYFDFSENAPFALGRCLPVEQIEDYRVNAEMIERFMGDSDIIISMKNHYPYALWQDYANEHVSDDARRLVSIVHELYPEADESMIKVFMRCNAYSPCNMFIMRYDLFTEYAEWLFDILAVAEQRIDLSAYSVRQARIFGYFAERLMNVWVDWKGLRAKHVPVLAYGDVKYDSSIKNIINTVRRDLAFYISRPSNKSAKIIFDRFVREGSS